MIKRQCGYQIKCKTSHFASLNMKEAKHSMKELEEFKTLVDQELKNK